MKPDEDVSVAANQAALSVCRQTHGRADLEDLKSEAQLIMLQILPKFDATRHPNLPMYIYVTTRYRLMDYLRAMAPGCRMNRNIQTIDITSVAATLADRRPNPEQQYRESEALERLEDTIRRAPLNVREKKVLEGLRRGLMHSEIAAELGVSESWINQLSRTVKAKLRAVAKEKHDVVSLERA